MHEVVLSRAAQSFLEKLPAETRGRILTRLRRLCDDPIPPDAKFFGRHQHERVFRYRIGAYRVLYKVKTGLILVAVIDKRSRVYDR